MSLVAARALTHIVFCPDSLRLRTLGHETDILRIVDVIPAIEYLRPLSYRFEQIAEAWAPIRCANTARAAKYRLGTPLCTRSVRFQPDRAFRCRSCARPCSTLSQPACSRILAARDPSRPLRPARACRCARSRDKWRSCCRRPPCLLFARSSLIGNGYFGACFSPRYFTNQSICPMKSSRSWGAALKSRAPNR